jgi:surface carbohydrate biosynthesis protein
VDESSIGSGDCSGHYGMVVPVRILLPCDHLHRDLPGHAALQVEIENTSPHEVLICDIHLLPQMAELYKPHLLVMNHLHDPDRNKIVDSVRRRGGLCAVLSTEGRSNTDEQVEWAARKFDTRLCDLYLSWSQEFANHLTVPYAVTGCPRFDFYSDLPHRGELLSLYGLTDDKPVITVASSFPQAKFAGFGTDFLVADWKKLGVSKIPGRENPAEIASKEKEALKKFMAWLENLLAENDYQMIVKAHPAEDVQPWREFCSRTGAKLMLTDYIWNMLVMSDVHVARVGCLTAVEAWMAGKQSVQCAVGNDFVSGATLQAIAAGLEAWSYENLSEWVADVLAVLPEDDQAQMYVDQTRYIEKWLGPRGNSAKLTAKAIVDLLEDKKPKLAFEFGADDRASIHKILMTHSQQYAVPQADHIGQFSKTTTFASVQSWLEKVRSKKNEQ